MNDLVEIAKLLGWLLALALAVLAAGLVVDEIKSQVAAFTRLPTP